MAGITATSSGNLMLGLPPSVQIYLATAPTDLRKGFDGLAGLVTQSGFDVFSGHLFVFVSKQRNRIKILHWDRGGFMLHYKRLERGRFQLPPLSGNHVTLDSNQLSMLLDGVHMGSVRRNVAWKPIKQQAA